ncbi:MAG: glycoside hydrolase family 15 protein [Pseudonocardiaceae bacterium]
MAAEFFLDAGEHVDFRLTWSTPRAQPPEHVDVGKGIHATEAWWRDWASTCRYDGQYRDAVVRSLITLKAMSYGPSGGIVAAPIDAGYEAEAVAWREWLLRALAGRPEQMQLMYGVEGERRLAEYELDWLPGYAGSRPVRVGNAASRQFQLGGRRRWRDRPWVVLAAGLVAAGLGLAALGLIGAQALLVGDFCTFCLTSAALSVLVAVLVIPEVLAAVRRLRERRTSRPVRDGSRTAGARP